MVDRDVGAVLVMEGEALSGILTERDVLRAVAAGIEDETVVADWMTRDPETMGPDDTTQHAAVLMIHGGFRHLPLVEGERRGRDAVDPRPDAGRARQRRAARRLGPHGRHGQPVAQLARRPPGG